MSEIRADKIHNVTGDNDSGIDLSTNDQVVIKTADTTSVTVDSSQRVNVGTGTPPTADSVLTVQKSSAANEFNVISSPSHASVVNLGDTDDYNICRIKADNSNNSLQFQTNNSEQMRIDNEGNLLVGGTSDTGFQIVSTALGNNGCLDCISSSTNGYYALRIDMHANNNYAQLFRQGGSVVGTILISSGSTSYNTSSDYRLKENVTYDFDATSRLKQLKPCRFNFKIDADKTKDGFLAHEVSSIVPEAVSGEKDAVDADGNIDPQGIDQSKLVPLLVKTIQELEARITALENK
jgi:hypothetical protein